MSRPVTNNSVLEVAFRGTGAGGMLMNIWHYRLEGAGSSVVDGDAIVNLLKAQIQSAPGSSVLNSMCLMCHETVNWHDIRYQWITPLRYTPVTSTVGNGSGNKVDQALPMNVAGVWTLRTLFAGRAGIGRKHFGGLSVSAVSSSEMTPAFEADCQAVMLMMTLPVNCGPVSPGLMLQAVVYHRVDPTVSHVITGYEMQTTSRVMRRRTVSVGK